MTAISELPGVLRAIALAAIELLTAGGGSAEGTGVRTVCATDAVQMLDSRVVIDVSAFSDLAAAGAPATK